MIIFKIEWSDGKSTWVKKCNLPKVILKSIDNGEVYNYTHKELKGFGSNGSTLERSNTVIKSKMMFER